MKKISLLAAILVTCLASSAWAGQQCDNCKSTAQNQPTVTTVAATVGTGCNKIQATNDGLDQIGDNYCVDANSPQCAGTCNNQNFACQATATPTDVGPTTFQKITVQGCKNNMGQQATIPAGIFTCYCKCRQPGGRGTVPQFKGID